MAPCPPPSILVLEDHPFQRKVVLQLLQQAGIKQSYEAEEGQQALNLLRALPGPVNIVICDLMMEGMDGVQFIRHIGEEKLADAVVILSGLDDAVTFSVASMVKAHGLRLLGRLNKPLNQDQLERVLTDYQASTAVSKKQTTPAFSRHDFIAALKNQNIEAYFQPKLSTKHNRCVGLEALARWNHPTRGLLPPIDFIPHVEALELEHELAIYMLDRACQQAAQLCSAGHEIPVSLNVSLKSLEDVNFPARVEQALNTYALAPHDLVIEVTETAFSTRTAYSLECLARLRMLGIGLSIDDYGTGYSSLLQLSSIPFTELKIDQAFISRLPKEERFRDIVSSTLELATSLGLNTVAEGVEQPEQALLLQQLGCQQLQGFLYAKPMASSELTLWLNLHLQEAQDG